MLISDLGYNCDMSQQRSDLKHAINEPRKSEGQKFMRYFTLGPNTNSLQNPIVSDISFPKFLAHRKMINSNIPLNSIILPKIILHLRCVFLSLGKVFRHPGFTFHPPGAGSSSSSNSSSFPTRKLEVDGPSSSGESSALLVAGCGCWLLIFEVERAASNVADMAKHM